MSTSKDAATYVSNMVTRSLENENSESFRNLLRAVADLDDVRTYDTDRQVALMRRQAVDGFPDDDPIPYDQMRWIEVLGIAGAIETRFKPHQPDAPEHNRTESSLTLRGLLSEVFDILPPEPYEIDKSKVPSEVMARVWADYLNGQVRRWIADHPGFAGPSTLRDSDTENEYRDFLSNLIWIHRCGHDYKDTLSPDSTTYICPITAYLQLIVRSSPVSDWAAACAGSYSTPLAFVWAWARASSHIGQRTADVVVFLSMSRQALVLLRDEEKARLKRNQSLARTITSWFTGAFTRPHDESSTSKDSVGSPQFDPRKQFLADMEGEVENVIEEGKRYAQLLDDGMDGKDVEAELERVAATIRMMVGYVLGRIEPPVPEEVLLVVQGSTA